jgi:hypothetical protein
MNKKYRAVAANVKLSGKFYPAGSSEAFELTADQAEQLGDNVVEVDEKAEKAKIEADKKAAADAAKAAAQAKK